MVRKSSKLEQHTALSLRRVHSRCAAPFVVGILSAKLRYVDMALPLWVVLNTVVVVVRCVCVCVCALINVCLCYEYSSHLFYCGRHSTRLSGKGVEEV